MDCFFTAVPLRRKTRLHFHEFMREVHRELRRAARARPTRSTSSARRIAQRYRLICFDEFHVADIADAMILHRLLDALFDNGVGVRHDVELRARRRCIPNGLHRDRILPAIELLKDKLDVINVDAGVDYRQPHAGAGRSSTTRRSAPRPTRRCASAFDAARRGARRRPGAAHRAARDPRAAPRRRRRLVRLRARCAAGRARRTTTWRSPASSTRCCCRTCRRCRPRHGVRGAPLHLAGRRALRPRVKLIMSAEVAAGGAVHRRPAGARVPAHRLAHHRDAVAGISGDAATHGRYFANLNTSIKIAASANRQKALALFQDSDTSDVGDLGRSVSSMHTLIVYGENHEALSRHDR